MAVDLDLLFSQTSDTVSETVELISESVSNSVITENFNFDDILLEWSYRCDKGYPVWGDVSDMWHLQCILEELGVEVPFDRIAEAPKKKLSQTAKTAPSTIENANTPEMKEGLVIYFSSCTDGVLTAAENKVLDSSNSEVLSLPFPKHSEVYGGKSFQLVTEAIKFLNENSITANNSRLYLNAISIAKYIRNEFGILPETSIDRGDLYTKIREHAIDLIHAKYALPADEDKWCPADIYIYNQTNIGQQAIRSDELNIGKTSLNSLFSTKFGKGYGIVGISLKESKAQAGKATSFKQILTRDSDYPDALTLKPEEKTSLELLYNLNILFSKDTAKLTPKLRIGYVAEAARIISSKKLKNVTELFDSLDTTLKNTFGSEYSKIFGARGGFNKNVARSVFESLKLKEVRYDSRLESLVRAYDTQSRASAMQAYTKSKKVFTDTLKRLNFNQPSGGADVDKMDSETLYKKASCYLVADFLLSGLNAEKLHIPSGYTSIIKQKNAFVAMTAYAIGMAGISPTFFKLVGSDNRGGHAHMEPFYGDGFLNLDDKSEVRIVDTTKYKGFFVEFFVNVTLTENKSEKIKTKYKVTLDFRYAGDQLNIEVSELKTA